MKKHKWIIIAAVCVAVCLGLFGWFGRAGGALPGETTELYGLFDSEEEAKECAALYGIEMISYSMGVAVFITDQNPDKLIAKGEKNGGPPISVNHKVEAL